MIFHMDCHLKLLIGFFLSQVIHEKPQGNVIIDIMIILPVSPLNFSFFSLIKCKTIVMFYHVNFNYLFRIFLFSESSYNKDIFCC